MMDAKQFGRQMVDLNKKALDHSFLVMNTIQAQSEKAVMAYMEQMPWFPIEARNLVTGRINTYKDWCSQFKATVDDHFRKMEDYYSVSEGGKTKPNK